MKVSAPCSRGLPGSTGPYCPAVQHAPRTRDAIAVWRAVSGHPGLLRYAGMDGTVTGLELQGVVAAALGYGGQDVPFLQELIGAVEAGIGEARAEMQEKAE